MQQWPRRAVVKTRTRAVAVVTEGSRQGDIKRRQIIRILYPLGVKAEREGGVWGDP